MRPARYRTRSLRGASTRAPRSPESGGSALSVSQLVGHIRSTLEAEHSSVAVVGEISNLASPASGHLYFNLKDDQASLRTVLFRGSARSLRFRPENGQSVVARGRVSVYPARGDLQLIAESIEPDGIGALALAFEQLKERLAAEGLFDPGRKRTLPALPRRVGVVTSATGSVIRDIVQVARRRHPGVGLLVAPVRVQGEGSAGEIADAIRQLGASGWVDLIIVARGGGSLEDLWAFNEEEVARAIASCPVPIVSAVGHETDVTIADFASDLRAPTPSAAAELVVPERRALQAENARLAGAIESALRERVTHAREALERDRPRPGMLRRGLADRRQRLDDQGGRTSRALRHRLVAARTALASLQARHRAASPATKITLERERLGRTTDRLAALACARLGSLRASHGTLEARLRALDPNAAVARGYALVRPVGGGALVRSPSDVREDQELEVHLALGRITVRVTDAES